MEKLFCLAGKNDLSTYGNIRKISLGQGDDYTSSCLLDYKYLKNCCRLIVIGVSKKNVLDADPKTMLQVNFTGNVD